MPLTDEQILDQFHHATAGPFLRDEHGRGLLRMRGNDARDLLHRLSSARIDNLGDGELRETLLTTEKGRVIDALLVTVEEGGLRLLTSPGRTPDVRAWLEKFTIMEDCTYEDASATVRQVSVFNLPDDPSTIPFGFELPPAGKAATVSIDGHAVDLLRHDSVSGPGLRLLVAAVDSDAVLRYLENSAGLSVIGDEAFALWRIERLLPAMGAEMGEHSNPLEAGAGQAVDFRKGCFIGQEVIARLDSYDKVQRHPCRLRFSGPGSDAVAHGAALTADGAVAGLVTTVAFHPGEKAMLGIGLVRNAHTAPGTLLRCGEAEVEVIG